MAGYLDKLVEKNLAAIATTQGVLEGIATTGDFTEIKDVLTYQAANVKAQATVSFAGNSQNAEGSKLREASGALRGG